MSSEGIKKGRGDEKTFHTHMGSPMDELLRGERGKRHVIIGGKLYFNSNKDGVKSEDHLNGVDYSLDQVPITNLSLLGLYLSIGVKQFLSKRV